MVKYHVTGCSACDNSSLVWVISIACIQEYLCCQFLSISYWSNSEHLLMTTTTTSTKIGRLVSPFNQPIRYIYMCNKRKTVYILLMGTVFVNFDWKFKCIKKVYLKPHLGKLMCWRHLAGTKSLFWNEKWNCFGKFRILFKD